MPANKGSDGCELLLGMLERMLWISANKWPDDEEVIIGDARTNDPIAGSSWASVAQQMA